RDGVERVMAGKVERRSVKLIAAGAGDRVHRRASEHAVTCGAHARFRPELLQRIRERHGVARVVAGIIVVTAVNQKQRAVAGAAGDRNRDGVWRLAIAGQPGRVDRRTREQHELRGLAAIQGQANNLFLRYERADAGARRVDQWRLAGHLHRLLERANFQRHVDRARVTDREHDARLLEGAEAAQFRDYLVRTDREIGEDVFTARARDD